MKYFTYIVILVVAAAIVAGFFVVGSPKDERLRRFDERRVEDLQNIQSQIIYYWQRKEQLPASLEMLRDDLGGFQVPKDPETGSPYEYKIKGPLSFALCANFVRPSDYGTDNSRWYVPAPAYPESKPYSEPSNWQHGTGYVCFERTIDKDLYPVRKPSG